MSSSPLLVPRKVALTAVRGLLVGTSCTLALVAEDRRRRINNALRVIENGEKIRSARNYHGAGENGPACRQEEGGFPLDPIAAALLKHGVSLELEGKNSKEKRKSKKSSSSVGAGNAPDTPASEPSSKTRSSAREPSAAATNETPYPGVLPFGTPITASFQGTGIPLEFQEREAKTETRLRGLDILSDRRFSGEESASMLARFESLGEHPEIEPISGLSMEGEGKPDWAIPPLVEPSTTTRHTRSGRLWPTLSSEILKSVAARSSEEVMIMVQETCCGPQPDLQKTSGAVLVFLSVCDNKTAPRSSSQWVETSALLCRTCQDVGLVKEAESVFRAIRDSGLLSLEDYLAHNPLTLIKSLIGLTQNCPDRNTNAANLDSAVEIFTAKLRETPTGANTEVYETGVALIEALFQANHVWHVNNVFKRCLVHVSEDQPNRLADWFLGQLIDHGEYKKAVDFFLGRNNHFSLERESLVRTAHCVVEAVQRGYSYKPHRVLKVLVKLCSGVCDVHFNWIAKIFTAHWDLHHDFEGIEKLFRHLLDAGLEKITLQPLSVYRLMAEIALKAGNVEQAQGYFEAAATFDPTVLTHPLWLGLFAKHKAREGNWQSVRILFSEMVASDEERSKDLATVFVPVLKLHAEKHSLRETDHFAKLYTSHMKVPLCSYTVTLMMKHHAANRHLSGVLEWLSFCQGTRFSVDADISNGLLSCCRKFNMPFRNIRTIFRKLQAINPDFVDRHTEKIMADLALRNTSLNGDPIAGRRARGRLLSMRLKLTNKSLAGKGRPAPEQDIVLAMQEAMVIGGHARALWIYKRALHHGMRPSVRALRLAVRAELSLPDRDESFRRIQEILRYAKSHGQDVEYVTNQVIVTTLKNILETTYKGDIYDEVQATIKHFQKGGIALSNAAFNWAARACLIAKQFNAAVHYAHKAAEAVGPGTKLCHNSHNFKTLLMCYVELLDVDKLHETIELGFCSRDSEDDQYLMALKVARKRARFAGSASDVAEAVDEVLEQRRLDVIGVITQGITKTVGDRAMLYEQRQQLEEVALQTMAQAADLDVNCHPVDFDTIPWLGGKALVNEGNGA